MINEDVVKKAVSEGLPSLIELFKNLSKEDALKGLGILVVLGIATSAIEAVKQLVLAK